MSLNKVLIVIMIGLEFSSSRVYRGNSLMDTRSNSFGLPNRWRWRGVNPSLQNLETNQRCRPLRPVNGKSRSRQKGRFAMFTCNQGYQLIGSKHAVCEGGEWDVEAPVCVKSGCPTLPKPEHGMIYYTNRNSVAMLFCDPGYEINGSSMAYCNGQVWNGTFSKCKGTYREPELSCDFESEDICGWTHDPTHDFDWRRHNYTTPSNFVGTGPQHDHTLGANKGGHYMYIESSSRIENQTARLFSPLYRGNISDGCFVFFYHMYGRSIGTLNIYMKPEGVEVRTILENPDIYKMFEKSMDQGNVWHMGFFYLNSTSESFQIVIEGVNGPSYASDIAVDDVEILQEPMCANVSTLQITSPEEEGGYVDIQSCVNRCYTYGNSTVAGPSVQACDCTIDCDETSSCCLDYFDACIFDSVSGTEPTDLNTEVTAEYTTYIPSTEIIQTTQSTSIATNKPTTNIITIKTKAVTIRPTSPTTTKLTTYTTKTTTTSKPTTVQRVTYAIRTPKQTKPTTIRTTKSTPRQTTRIFTVPAKRTTSKQEYTTVDERIKELEVKKTGGIEIMTDYIDDQDNPEITEPKQRLVTENKQSIIPILLIIAGVLCACIIASVAFWRYRRRGFHYKNSANRGRQQACRGADEEFSEVRYLTADEQLDFTLATPDGD